MGGDRPRRRPSAGLRVTTSETWPDRLSGPVDVCVAVPKLSLDRSFTYVLPEGAEAGTGSLVSVSFHGRTVKGWVVGPTSDPPDGRLLPVRKVQSPVRFFDPQLLALFRWMQERYIAPLSTVIERSYPPRVVSEEKASFKGSPSRLQGGANDSVLDKYAAESLIAPGRTSWVRPLPGEEAETCVAAIARAVAGGKRAIVLVPEADPVPATARAVMEEFGDRAVAFMGGDERSRYRSWLHISRGRFDVVVGTRPAVFAPLTNVGLLWISREVHPGHREDRAPYYHVRDVAAARATIGGAACVLASYAPSVETAVASRLGTMSVFRPPRAVERAAAPLVETTPPDAEDRSARLGALLKKVRTAALIVSRGGYGVARVCRTCGSPAACAQCRGSIIIEHGRPTCRVCSADGVCVVCGSGTFGVERGGVERVAEWAERVSGRTARQASADGPAAAGEGVVVGTAASVKEWGRTNVDLVAILDPDRALSNPGIHAGERALATWMEAAAWAGPRGAGGRVLLQTRRPAHRAVQSLVRWDPAAFLDEEAERRSGAGFPPLHPLFRIIGDVRLMDSLKSTDPSSLISTTAGTSTICLVSIRPDFLAEFRKAVLGLVAEGVVDRVEAEPQL